jgi:NitT/TauT family transport system substrate-binding protein
MNYQNFIKQFIIYIAIITSLISCSSNRADVTLVYPNKVNYETFIIANHLNYFSQLGSKIRITTVNSGIDAAEALNLGSANIAAMGDGPAVLLMSQERDISIVSRYAKGNRIHRLISDTSITTPQDLFEKKIGIQMSSSTHGAFLGWLEANNIPVDNIELVPMNPKNMPEAMKNKQLDAIAGSEPWALNVERLCKKSVHELTNLESKKNHFPHVIVATSEFVQENEETVRNVQKIIDQANTFIVEQPDSASSIISHYIGISPGEAKTCMSRLLWKQGWEESDTLSLLNTADFFLQAKKIKKRPVISRYRK